MTRKTSSRRPFARRRPLHLESLEDRAVPATLSNFLTQEHVDLNIGYSGGTFTLNPRNNDTQSIYAPDDALFYVGKDAKTPRQSGSDFDFIGVPAGVDYYRIPQSQNPNLLLFGFAGFGMTASDFDKFNPTALSKGRVTGVGRWLKVNLVDVQGPGAVSVWQSGDTEPVVLISSYDDGVSNPNGNGLDTTDGLSADDAVFIVAGGHIDYNVGFTQKGRYELTFQITGYTPDGNDNTQGAPFTSQPITVYFSVGNVGQLEFDASTYAVSENAGQATITVHRVGGSDGRLTVNYATSNGTATAGADYTAQSGTFTFDDLETSKQIVIPIINDSADEADETINLTLSAAGPTSIENYVRTVEGSNLLAANTTAVLTIQNDDSPAGNTPPTISDVPDQSTNEDTPTGAISFTVGDTQSALADLVVTAVSSNQALVPEGNIVLGGSGANRTVTLTPVANKFGTTTITLTVRDTGGLTATDTFLLTVNSVNDPPTADDQSLTTPQETPLPITLTGDDIEDDPLTFNVVTGPSHGNLTGVGASRTYTPALGYTGPDSFTFKTNDGQADSASATVSITVTAENVPVANPDAYVVGAGSTVRGNVLFNDTDADGDPLTVSVVTGPSHGTLDLKPDGSFTYAPDATFAGTDSFQYQAQDDTGRTATATATISAAVPQPMEGVVAEGHADIGLNYEDGAWDLHIHDEEHDVEFEPNGALYYVAPEAISNRPAGSQFDFIGVGAGQPFYRLPQSLNPEVLFLGFGAEELAPGTFQNGHLDLALKAVNGPGQFSLWESTDTGPRVLWATTDGITAADSVRVLEGSHFHANFGFTARGRYEITVEAHGLLNDGDNVEDFSGEVTYYFSVDNLGTIQFDPVTYGVAEGKSIDLTVRRTGGSDGPATVAYTAVPGTASTKDYFPTGGELTFADGETVKTFTFITRKDLLNEAVETAFVNLTVPDGSAAQLGATSTATVLIDKPAALKAVSLRVNDGAAQRSNIETLAIRFSRDTNVPALIVAGTITDAVKLFVGTTQVTLDPSRFFYYAAKNTLVIGLTTGGFDPDTKTILADGRYELRLDTTLIKSGAGAVSLSDTDRTVDGTQRFKFHRLEGDLNGDKKVTAADLFLLRQYLGTYWWQRRYNFAFDLTGPNNTPDAVIDQLDATYLRTLFGRTV
jgi:surface-anchored protein